MKIHQEHHLIDLKIYDAADQRRIYCVLTYCVLCRQERGGQGGFPPRRSDIGTPTWMRSRRTRRREVIGERRVLEEDVVQELSNSLALALLAGPCPGEVLQSKYLMASPQMTLLDTQKIGPLSKGGSHTHINIEWVICPSKYTKLQIFPKINVMQD